MEAYKNRISVCLFGLAALMMMPFGQAGAQTLCGVTKIVEVGSGRNFNISFDGRKDFKISAAELNAGLVLDLRGRVTMNAANRPIGVQAKRGDNIYLTDGPHQACVITQTERDGKRGFYIEQHFHAHGQPPQLLTEFIEAR